jgi:hypothetical protein
MEIAFAMLSRCIQLLGCSLIFIFALKESFDLVDG